MTQIGDAAAAARQAAIEAAKRAAEAAQKQAAEAARKAAAQAPKKPPMEAAKPPAAKDEAKVEEGAGKIEAAAKSEDKTSPWSLTAGISKIIELGGDLGRTAKRGLEAMAEADAKKTAKFIEKTSGSLSGEGREALDTLEKSGKLTDRDSHGSNLRDNMERYLEEGGDPKQAEAILKQIAHPDREIRQMRDETCVAATNLRDLAQQNPGEYFRMATDLADHGRTTFPDGQKLELTSESQDFLDKIEDPGDRVSAAMQGALMEFANGAQDYNLASDTSSTNLDIGFADFNIMQGSGLNIQQANSLQDALGTAPTVDPRDLKDTSDPERMDHISQAVDEARQDGHRGVQIPIHSDDLAGKERFHMVEVRAIEGDHVRLWDVRTQQSHTMSRQDFLDNVAWDITANDDIGSYRVRIGAVGSGSV